MVAASNISKTKILTFETLNKRKPKQKKHKKRKNKIPPMEQN